MPETYAYFYIDGFACEPEAITTHLGVTPSKTWRAGDPHPKRKNHFFERSGWQVESGLSRDTYDMAAPVSALVDVLLARFERFSSLPAHQAKGINCVGYYFSENPGFGLTPELAAKIAKLGLSVDFDLYNLRDSDELWFSRAPE